MSKALKTRATGKTTNIFNVQKSVIPLARHSPFPHPFNQGLRQPILNRSFTTISQTNTGRRSLGISIEENSMKPHSHLILGAIVATFPLTAAAQDISGAATLGFGTVNASDGFADASVLSLDGRVGVTYGNGLTFGATASTATANPEGTSEDISVNTLGLNGGVVFASLWRLGGYAEFAEVDISGLGSEQVDSYGLTAGYASDIMDFEAFVGQSDTDLLAGTGVDWNDLGARLSYNIGSEGAVGGHFVRSRLSAGGTDVDLTTVGLGGHYDFGQGLVGFAGITHAEVDTLVGDLTTFGVGFGYDLSSVANVPATLSLELARAQFDDGIDSYNEDTIRFGVTLPLGGGKTAPLNSVANSAMSPNRTALSSALVGAF
jgi:hypothetical protein